ncbi:branched-chain amino acid transporter permease [Catenisphaera adipataccumulans]|jgi:branched-subunit amino acid transport protein AzlD|uniref:Branched-subunit amino acid transport protein AzlD n=1 Tax=Catenisphaera adipataccumulans TaxID=700500 RepID=A0A7W8FWW1_9FIRM|nr:AzlD domain-containing protein [Catenisphaera adipataccumulans]MBB5183716.1 branched-subunit amino acid transport protein AzlD [Catenisphaera adipataccumulans]
MTMTAAQTAITILIVIAGTVFTRFISYIAFPEGRPIPSYILYLGKVLGAAVFGLLVIYCFRNVDVLTPFSQGGTHGIPELIALLVTGAVYCSKRQMMLAMAFGTAVYMFLLQVVF